MPSFAACAVVCLLATLVPAPAPAQSRGTSAAAMAHVAERWPLRRADSAMIGVISHVVGCDDRVYVLALTRKTVYVARLGQPELRMLLGPDVLGKPLGQRADLLAMFVDCQANTLSVVVPTRLVTFALATGQVVRTYDFPPEFAPTKGMPHYDPTNHRVFLTGLWPSLRLGWVRKPDASMFSDTTFGLMLDLSNGTMSRFLPRAEEGCRTFGGDCLASSFAHTGADGWVFAHRVSTSVAVVRSGKITSTIDMRSPKFLYRAGDTVAHGSSREAVIGWGQRNSIIHDLFVVGSRIVAVHSHDIAENWKPGAWVQFGVYANVFTLGGAPAYTDLKLPDLPVGADRIGLWVVSYPPPGRTNDAVEIVLQRVLPSIAPPSAR